MGGGGRKRKRERRKREGEREKEIPKKKGHWLVFIMHTLIITTTDQSMTGVN